MKILKRFHLLLISVVLLSSISCKTSKNNVDTTKTTEVTPDTVVDDKLIGVLESNKDCGFVIRVQSEEGEKVYLPDNLEKVLQIENIKVKFSHEVGTQKPSPACSKCIPIHLKYITRLR